MKASFVMLAALPSEMDGFADIEGPVFSDWPLWLGLGGGLAVLLLLLLLWRRLRHRREVGTTGADTPPPEPPVNSARRRLDEVEGALDRYEAEPLTVAVSDIVRAYLEAVLSLPVREQTSEEFLEALRRRPDQPAVLEERLPRFLTQCDFVKFARQDLNPEGRRNLLATARGLVEETDRAASTEASASASPPSS